MMPKFSLTTTKRFEERVRRMPRDSRRQLASRLKRLASDPRAAVLKTREVEGAAGEVGERIFESNVGRECRLTWEYGLGRSEIILRNLDNL